MTSDKINTRNERRTRSTLARRMAPGAAPVAPIQPYTAPREATVVPEGMEYKDLSAGVSRALPDGLTMAVVRELAALPNVPAAMELTVETDTEGRAVAIAPARPSREVVHVEQPASTIVVHTTEGFGFPPSGLSAHLQAALDRQRVARDRRA